MSPVETDDRSGANARGDAATRRRGWAVPAGVAATAAGAAFVALGMWLGERVPRLSSAEIDFVASVACGTEYGGGPPRVHKWRTPIRVVVHGDPSDADEAEVSRVLADARALLPSLGLTLVSQGGNVDVHFRPQEDLASLVPQRGMDRGQEGACWVTWDEAGVVTHATVLIANEVERPQLRKHLIREELTQALGPLRDDCRRKDSVFYCGYSEVTELAPIDKLTLLALYDPGVPVGADEATLRAALKRLRRPTVR